MKRLNRCRLEWLSILSPHEYCLLDKMLFQSNLTHANQGQGFKFHVRQLAKETRLSTGFISSTTSKWNFFISKSGKKREMIISFDYNAFLKWIVHPVNNTVHPVNNDCSSSEPRSIKEESITRNKNTKLNTRLSNKPKYESYKIAAVKSLMVNCPLKIRYPQEHITFINNLNRDFGVDLQTLVEIYNHTNI